MITQQWYENFRQELLKNQSHNSCQFVLSVNTCQTLEELQQNYNLSEICYWYAWITKKKFPEGESVISLYSNLACHYSLKILKERFPEGENRIFNNPDTTKLYLERFGLITLKKRYLYNSEIRKVVNDYMKSHLLNLTGSDK